jgi:hypothetical protein
VSANPDFSGRKTDQNIKTNIFSLAADVAFQADFFGRFRRATKAARATRRHGGHAANRGADSRDGRSERLFLAAILPQWPRRQKTNSRLGTYVVGSSYDESVRTYVLPLLPPDPPLALEPLLPLLEQAEQALGAPGRVSTFVIIGFWNEPFSALRANAPRGGNVYAVTTAGISVSTPGSRNIHASSFPFPFTSIGPRSSNK